MNRLISLLFFFFLIGFNLTVAQIETSFLENESYSGKRKKPKNSMAKGTGFVYWGYNRSAYTRSTIHFEGAGYDFSLKGVKAKDR
ncbi:MAG: hypothetical protein ACKO7D_01555, partial [Bacteroidota bacterium]